MKEKSKGEGSGWREPADPTCIGKDGKAKAKRHHEVAVKKEAGEALNKPMKKGESKEAVVFEHEKPISDDLLDNFCKKFNKELNQNQSRSKISVLREDASAFMEFMSYHGIELEEIQDSEMVEAHIATTEAIVEEVQGRRKESAKAKDNSKTAKNIGDKEDASALVDWVKNPAKSDLEGVDTKE